MTYNLPRLVACGVFVVMFSTLSFIVTMFIAMYATGETTVLLDTNRYGEFWIEFAIFILATIFMPVLLYEISEFFSSHNRH